MALYNNSAGRILEVFARLGEAPNEKKLHLPQLADAFGVTHDWQSVLRAFTDLRGEFDLLCEEISHFQDNTAKYSLYKRSLPDIEAVFASFSFNISRDIATFQGSKAANFAIQFIAADLPQDGIPSDGELNRIRQLVNELQVEIESSTEFTKSVREWLLDLVRIIRDSLDRYVIRGGRGMRQQFAMLLGELMMNVETANKVREKKPSVWQKFTEALDTMNKVVTLSEKLKPAVSFAQKLLPMVKGLLSGPDDTAN